MVHFINQKSSNTRINNMETVCLTITQQNEKLMKSFVKFHGFEKINSILLYNPCVKKTITREIRTYLELNNEHTIKQKLWNTVNLALK